MTETLSTSTPVSVGQLGAVARLLSSAASDKTRIEESVRFLALSMGAEAAVFYQRSTVRGAAPLIHAFQLTPYTVEQMTHGLLRSRMEAFISIMAVAEAVREADLIGTFFEGEEGLKWAASFPVWSADHVAGVVIIAWRHRNPLGPEEEALCQAVANLIGIAVRPDVVLERGTELAVLRERARMARDIHDSVTQSITAIVLNLEAATRGPVRMPPATRSAVEASIDVARASLVELRRSIWNLRASAGRVKSLSESLVAVAAPLDSAGITFDVQVHGAADRLSDELTAALLSIAREALNNVVRHSRATRVEILVNVTDDSVVLGVTDNGVGATEPPGPACFGIFGMRERAAAFGGSLILEAVTGLGTRVECVLPFRRGDP